MPSQPSANQTARRSASSLRAGQHLRQHAEDRVGTPGPLAQRNAGGFPLLRILAADPHAQDDASTGHGLQ
jgi:hypothetical protein